MTSITANLDSIQGNVIGGFNKDFQDFIFLKFKSATAGRAWLKELADPDFDAGVTGSSSAQVLKFNGEFKALKASGLKPEQFISVAWTNFAVTFHGLAALGVNTGDLAKFPADFHNGMKARNHLIGDVGTSDPAHWIAPFNAPIDLHAVLIVAADSLALLQARSAAIVGTAAFMNGVTVLPTVEGRVRSDEPGHEHFGFKDGVSQPGIREVTPLDDPIGNPEQGQPGQDLLWSGEFVLGYPTQIPTAKTGVDGPNPEKGPLSASGPAWTKNGSYLVFRRLAQDVPAFQQQLDQLAAHHGMTADLMGAKLVGRYKSGCPLETRTFEASQPPTDIDPGKQTPALADDDSLNNNFEFGDDKDGARCPLASHIRKAYPRDEQTLPNATDSESDTQTHRLLRRGIPFGASFGAPAGGGAEDPRGLIFVCYQKSIQHQFEFVQQSWVNNAGFPPFPATGHPPGEDPIIAQSPQGDFILDSKQPAITIKHFVTTTGGEYFFSPSIPALQELGRGHH